MKTMKKLIPALAMLLVSAVLLGTSTFAWFSMNKTVTATGMQVIATAEGSLIIKNVAPESSDSATEYNFNTSPAVALLASTHVDGTNFDFTAHDSALAAASGLIYNTNPAEVDANTGLKHGSTDLAFAAAANGGGKTYYQDYTVYIAASGIAMTAQDLTITISAPTGVSTLPAATSVDFYYTTDGTAPTPSSTTFAGTLNLAGLDPVTNDATTTQTSIVINGSGSGITIPLANGTAGVVVLMRVYIDGALKDSSTTTFIKTVDAAEIVAQTLTVTFVASSH